MISVRRAKIEDAEAIARIHVRGWQAAYRGIVEDAYLDQLSVTERTAKWREILANDASVVFVALDADGRVAAFCGLVRSRDADANPMTVELAALYVDPAHWRSGFGSAIVAVALSHAARANNTSCTLWVIEQNAPARAFYEAVGFRPDGATKIEDHYGGTSLHELRYRIAIAQPAVREPPKLAILETMREAIGEVWQRRRALLRATVAPAAVNALIGVSVSPSLSETLFWWITASEWALSALIAVSCHRIILLGEDSLPAANGVYWSTRELKFSLWSIAPLAWMSLASVVVLVPLTHIVSVFKIVDTKELTENPFRALRMLVPGALVGAYFFARASLILPSIAIDRPMKFGSAWRLSRKQGLRVAVITMALPSVWIALAMLEYSAHSTPHFFAIEAARSFVYTLLTVFEIAALSVTYRKLT